MGLTQTHALSRDRKFFSKIESSSGTYEKIAGTDAAKILKADLNVERERKPREDSRQTRSLLERITGRATVPWSIEAEVVPSGAAGTPPDLHPLFVAAMGGPTADVYTNTPSTSDAYVLDNSQSPETLTLYEHVSDVLSKTVWGAWVDELTISVASGETPKVKFSGGAMGHVVTGTSTLNGAMSGSTTMVVQTADGANFGVNSLVQIDAATNVLVTAAAAPSFTVDTSVTEDNASVVYPYAPAETTAGSPIAGISGSVTYDSDTLYVTGFEVTLKNNFRPLDDEALAEYVTDVVPGYREVTGKITVRARKDWVVHLANRKDFGTQAITVVLGSVAGSKLTISVPYAELDYDAIDVPAGDGDVVLSLPFVALGSSGEDELALTFS
jgi:hypothetical protein